MRCVKRSGGERQRTSYNSEDDFSTFLGFTDPRRPNRRFSLQVPNSNDPYKGDEICLFYTYCVPVLDLHSV